MYRVLLSGVLGLVLGACESLYTEDGEYFGPLAWAWNITCVTDELDESESCYVEKPFQNLAIGVSNELDEPLVLIGRFNDQHPGSEVRIRVDDGPVHEGEELLSVASNRKVMAELLQGEVATIRWVKWPGQEVTERVPLRGLAEKLEEAQARVGVSGVDFATMPLPNEGAWSDPQFGAFEVIETTGGWETTCALDELTNARMCITLYEAKVGEFPISVSFGNNASRRRLIKIGLDHQPGSEVVLRIDGGRIYRNEGENVDLDQVDEVMAALVSGREAHVRWVERPDVVHTVRVPLAGFEEQLELGQAWVRGETTAKQ